MVTYRGLYYPYIRFQDETWLKAAAIYWDQIGRIVPNDDYQPDDSETVRRLRSADVVTQFSARGADWRVGQAFEELIDRWGADLSHRYSVHDPGRLPATRRVDFAPPPDPLPGLDYVHIDKVSPALHKALSDNNLAIEGSNSWLAMHPRLVAVYMTVLAQSMSADRGALPLTDDVVDHIAIAGLDVTEIAQALLPLADNQLPEPERTDRDIEGAMASLAIESVLPGRLADMPVDEIIDLRNRNAAKRAAFQAGLGELVESLSHLEAIEPRDFAWHLRNEHTKHVQAPLAELKESLRENRIDVVSGLLSTQFAMPAGLGGVLLLLGVTVAAPVGIGLGAAVAVWNAARLKQAKDRHLQKASWVAYLLKVEQAGGADRVANDVLGAARNVRVWPSR